MDAKKLKLIVRGDKKPTFGTDPNEPWSVRAGITESERGELHAYLKSRGINPEFVSKDTKISHAKSSEFHKWRRDHQFDDPINYVSTTVADKMKKQRAQTEEVEIEEGKTLQHTPVELRQHAIDKEKHMTKVLHHNGLHKEESEQIDELAPETLASYVLKTTSKDPKRAEPRKKAMSKLAKIMAKRSFSEAKTIQGTALDKFRQSAADRARKHDDIEREMKARHAAGKEDMKGSIDRLEKQLNKEESGVSKSAETKFHKKLDKLVHSTFGKRKDELKMKEEVEQIDEKNVPTSPEKWARAKAAAKSKFAVYPSAYANGWASKKYKAMGGGWKSVKEETDLAEKNDSHTHAAHYEDPKTGEWTGMNLLIAKDDDDAIRQAQEKCKEGCRLTKVERHITVKEEVELDEGISDFDRQEKSRLVKARIATAKLASEPHDDKLLARTGMNMAHKFPRKGQTNLGNIPGMNTPGVSKDTADYAERRRGDRAKELKPAIKAALGTHGPKGKLPEEVEQIDELKKSTVFSWLKQQPVVPEKKPGMSRKDHNKKIKTSSKSWNRALDRLAGYKPTSEDVFQDTQAATQTPFDMGTQADDREPTYSKRKEMSKSARMIKSLYKKHKMVKEELYDHEKEDKSVATYGKKPKAEKQEVYGDDDTQAAMILKGGTTLTGQTRDTLEIDPVMRKPVRPDNQISDRKTDK